MGWLLIVSIAAMTSVMTMVQLIALTVTLPISPAPQANVGSQRTESVAVKTYQKKNEKVVSRKSATHPTRRKGVHSAHFNASHQKREAGYR